MMICGGKPIRESKSETLVETVCDSELQPYNLIEINNGGNQNKQ